MKMENIIQKITSIKGTGRMEKQKALEPQSIIVLMHINKEFISRAIKDLAKEKTNMQMGKLIKESL